MKDEKIQEKVKKFKLFVEIYREMGCPERIGKYEISISMLGTFVKDKNGKEFWLPPLYLPTYTKLLGDDVMPVLDDLLRHILIAARSKAQRFHRHGGKRVL